MSKPRGPQITPVIAHVVLQDIFRSMIKKDLCKADSFLLPNGIIQKLSIHTYLSQCGVEKGLNSVTVCCHTSQQTEKVIESE